MKEQFLGDYRILKKIGDGTLGSVLLAEHRFTKKQYTLKILPRELIQDKDFAERFEQEAAKLARLEHSHIVKIHTISFVEGIYFLVTDCPVERNGEVKDLAQYMSGRSERLTEEELLHMMRQIAVALDYAHHEAKVPHLALKLSNVLVKTGDCGVDVLISDFGLSKMISPGKIVAQTFKIMADRMGTSFQLEECSDSTSLIAEVLPEKLSQLSLSFLQNFVFLAPEQKRFEEVDAAADVYAFGVLVYFLISGKFPEGIFQMPSIIAPEYQMDWDELVIQCLQQNPKMRPNKLLALLGQKKRTISSGEAQLNGVGSLLEEIKPEKISLRPLSAQMTNREGPVLKPLIRTALIKDEKSESPLLATVTTSSNSHEETYAQQLNAMLNREPIVTHYLPEKKECPILEPLQTEMVIIPGGSFSRGSNTGSRDEMPCHEITLQSFALDIHPVTCEQFLRFLEFIGGEKDHNYNDLIRLKDSRLSRAAGQLSIESGYAKHPVVGVTWYGAKAYAKWAGKRLPTEAEWEIAAYGGLEKCLYPTGNQIEKNQANFFSSDTTPVMSYPPNGYGLYDMAGNVYEWCQDWYGYNYYEAAMQEPNDPKGPLQGVYRVLRGGCWKSLHEDMRCSYRHRNNPGAMNSTYGFRCAKNV